MCRPNSEPPHEPNLRDVHRAAVHEASHALLASKYSDWVCFWILPPGGVEIPEGGETLGRVGGCCKFAEFQDERGKAALAWAGFIGERMTDDQEIALPLLIIEATKILKLLAPLDWEALLAVPEDVRSDGAKLAYGLLKAEWGLVLSEAHLLEEAFRPPNYRVREFDRERGWHWH